MPELVVDDTARYPLRDGDVLVGRHSEDGSWQPDIDLGLLKQGRTVSRRAMHIYKKGGEWCVKVDAAARNATVVAGQPLLPDQEAPLRDGDVIRLGAVSLTFVNKDSVGGDLNMTIAASTEATAELRAEEGTGVYPLKAVRGNTLTVGRHSTDQSYRPDVDLRDLPGGATISRQHAEMFETERGWVMRVKGDVTNPTYLNQQLLDPGVEVLLTDDDKLRLGRVTVSFHERRQANYVGSDLIDLVVGPPNEISVEPGREVRVSVTVHNFTQFVDWFLLDVSGVHAGWCRWEVPDAPRGAPPLVKLLTTTPARRAPDARKTVILVISPPREATTRAGRYPLLVTATSQGHERLRRAVSAELDVLAFHDVSMVAEPKEVRGTQANYTVTISNKGNAPLVATLQAQAAKESQASLAHQEITLGNGDSRSVDVGVRGKRRWLGAPQTYATLVTATAGAQTFSSDVRLVTPPRVPLWVQATFSRTNSILKPILLPIIILGIVLGIAYLLLRPPDVRLVAQPTTVAAGKEAMLTWQVDRGSGAVLESNQEKRDIDLNAPGVAVTPQKQTEYKLNVRNWFGLVSTSSVTVDVLRIVSFTVLPDTLQKAGDPVQLQWETEGATRIDIEGSDEIKAPIVKGPLTVHPAGSTRFTLTASSADGRATDQRTAEVKLAGPKIARFERAQDRPQIYPGDPVILNWAATGWTSLTLAANMRDEVLSDQPRDVSTATSITARPLQSGTYTLVAVNAENQRDEKPVTITVVPPRIAAFTVDQDTIQAGQSTRLNWRVEGANDRTRVTIDQGVGDVEATGVRPISPAKTTTYMVTVIAADGTTQPPQNTTVNVLPTVLQFVSSAPTIVAGDSVDLSWSVRAADKISVTTSNGRTIVDGASAGDFSISDAPIQPTTYLLKASNAAGDAPVATVSVNVTQPAFPGLPPGFDLGDPNIP
jgi:pSer/pThr/pTyr-binding forkhead associated (FHA) protein